MPIPLSGAAKILEVEVWHVVIKTGKVIHKDIKRILK